MFVLGKPFQPCLVFWGQTLKLITETVNYGRNKFYDTGPSTFYDQVVKVEKGLVEQEFVLLIISAFPNETGLPNE